MNSSGPSESKDKDSEGEDVFAAAFKTANITESAAPQTMLPSQANSWQPEVSTDN